MADFPDYVSPINIIGQLLAEIINRPKYGGALVSEGHVDFTGIQTLDLTTISGKGMTYGGRIWSSSPNLASNDLVSEYTDANRICSLYLNTGDFYAFPDPRTFPLVPIRWDPVGPSFAMGTAMGITFENELKFTYWHKTGTAIRIYYEIVYALI